MQFQYFSNVNFHHETNAPILEVCAPNLVVAGGVLTPLDDKYESLMALLSEKFERVFIVTAPRCYDASLEFSRTDEDGDWMQSVDDRARAVCNSLPKKNVFFLQNDSYDIEGSDITVFGGTMWTHVSAEVERHIDMINSFDKLRGGSDPLPETMMTYLREVRPIIEYVRAAADTYNDTPGLTVAKVRRLHAQFKQSLMDAMDARPGRNFIIVTYHMPKASLRDPRSTHPLDSLFASNVPCTDDPRVVAWFYGTYSGKDEGKFHSNSRAQTLGIGKVVCVPCKYSGNPPDTSDDMTLLDFDQTSTAAVIDFLKKTESAQSRLRVAFDSGRIHEELTRLTHFTGPLVNRNIHGVDLNGSTVKVTCEGKIIRVDAGDAIHAILARNVEIANSEAVRKILDIDELGDVLSEAATSRQAAYDSRRIRLVIDNGGTYLLTPRPCKQVAAPVGRRSWSTRVRNLIAAQQGWECNACNAMLQASYDIDHVIPLFKGGPDSMGNLQALCVPCHRAKSALERTKA